ncbi:cadherin-like beta sandwich domain-containing protein, partial [uncultured Fenollaria sp.]|uniref:InlB B-repeat-containing protein n=1 Tax=uncultured Fenollaria sp. TaxID=1686315 RepID=UPI002600CECE
MDDIVYIDATTAPQGKVFDYWKKDGNDITILNPTNASTRFKMPARNVKVEAIYKIDPAVSAELKDIKAYVSGAGMGAWDTFSVTPNYDRATKEYTLAIPNKYNKIYFFLAWDDEGQKIVAKKDGADLGFSNKLSTGYNTNNAGLTDEASVYTFEVTSKDGKSTNIYKVTVTREASPLTPVNIPTAKTNLVYNGSPQIGVNEGTGYTLTGNIETNAGTYTAKATLEAGYMWSDGTTNDKEISFAIKKARPTYTEPANLTGKKGDKLSTVDLPAQFKWKNGNITLDTVGDNTYYAEFTPTDTENYEVIDVDLTVKVEEVAHNITVTNGTSSAATAKQGESVTVTATVPTDKEFDAWEATGITLTDTQKKENPLTITMPDNDITLTAKLKDKAPTVTAIAVNSTNHKTEYKVGEDLDVTNLTIEVTKS